MTVTREELARFANREADDYAQKCINEAQTLIEYYIGKAVVPDSVKDRAVLEVAANLVRRGGNMDGLASFDSEVSTPLRITRDPLQAARAILAPYLTMGAY